ncbi:MAG TPA: GNAT family protein [Gaiellaceae bacterium]|nr:GNAT family protein [Gaiellaceae bacterium]
MDVIRRLLAEDAEELTALRVRNRAYISPWEPDAEEPDRWYTVDGVRSWIVDGNERFAILDGGEIVGMASLTGVVRGGLQSAMASYFVDESHAGRGLASAAVHDLVIYAFEELGLHRIEAGTAVVNVASQRVLEKNGFRRVGLLERHLLLHGEWVDHYLFELVR